MIKFLHASAATSFLVMAVIQLNDPDPLYWTVVYALVAVVAVSRFQNTKRATLTHVSFGLALAGILMSAPGAVDYFSSGDFGAIYGKMMGEKPYVEYAREFGGSLIAVLYLLLNKS